MQFWTENQCFEAFVKQFKQLPKDLVIELVQEMCSRVRLLQAQCTTDENESAVEG